MELANSELAACAEVHPDVRGRVSFKLGIAEALPLADGSVDLVWCHDVLMHVAELDKAYGEFQRVLRDGGHVLM
jgi:ubiquinone/menaquinone biosynthesis C-methylase UbiE